MSGRCIALRNAAYDEVNSTGYSGLALRPLGFLTEPYVAAGSRLVLWSRAQQGLKDLLVDAPARDSRVFVLLHPGQFRVEHRKS